MLTRDGVLFFLIKKELIRMQQIECGICLLPMEFQQVHKKLDCQHSFHTECILKWFQYKVNCPLCRKGRINEEYVEEEEDNVENVLTLNIFIRCFYMAEFCFFTSVFTMWASLVLAVFITSLYRMLTDPPPTSFINTTTLLPIDYSSSVCYPHEEI